MKGYTKSGKPRKRAPGSGRKPVAEEVRQKMHSMRMTDSAWDEVRRAAEVEGLPAMTWMRQVLEAASKKAA